MKTTFTLAVPVTDTAGVTHNELTLTPPTLAHRKKLNGSTGSMEQTIAMLAILSGVEPSVIGRIKTRDAMAIRDWMQGLQSQAMALDAWPLVADEAGRQIVDVASLQSVHTFKLMTPIETNGEPITEVTVREPDLEAGVIVEKFKNEADQTAAMIATLSGHVIPVITRMTTADADRIDRWLSFFSQAGATSRNAPLPTASPPATAAIPGAV